MQPTTSEQITRKSASNLALAFVLLPRERREAMSALYAFCREVDDVADEESRPAADRQADLNHWRRDIALACSGGEPQLPVNRELQPVIRRYGLKLELFEELIRGVEMDLSITRYESHAELEQYCYRVASVVGLLSIEIFGYRNPASREYARHLGLALQLTNILRDVRVDAGRGRIYLPLEALRRHGVPEDDILSGRCSAGYQALAREVADRARNHYQRARDLLPQEDRRSMLAAELMGAVYWRLFRKLEAAQFDVFGPEPTRLSKPHKIFLILRTWLRSFSGGVVPNYGTP
ncbi:MAG TPA: squalene synthase HpnD [Verrucomicrobiales bacterium]|nr:squalene synthase HpnD [Verrucomicrobiales bacterium]